MTTDVQADRWIRRIVVREFGHELGPDHGNMIRELVIYHTAAFHAGEKPDVQAVDEATARILSCSDVTPQLLIAIANSHKDHPKGHRLAGLGETTGV